MRPLARLVSTAVLVGSLAQAAFAAKPDPPKIPVFLTSAGAKAGAQERFTDPDGGRRHGVKDLLWRLRRMKDVTVVSSADKAVLVLEVLERYTQGAHYRMVVRLTVGSFTTDLMGEATETNWSLGNDYDFAAMQIGIQLRHWIQENHARLLDALEHK